MFDPLIIVVVIVAVLLTAGTLWLLRRMAPMDMTAPQVRVLGAYSPFLTWIKYGRWTRTPSKATPVAAAVRAQPVTAPRADTAAASARPVLNPLEAENEILRQRVAELNARVADLENEAAPARPFSLAQLRPALIVAVPLVLAALPAWLVFQQQWLGNEAANSSLREAWCQVGFLCHLRWPAYFALIIPCALAVLALILLAPRALPLSWSVVPGLAAYSTSETATSTQVRLGRILLAIGVGGMLLSFAAAIAGQRLPGLEYAAAFVVFLAAWFVGEGGWRTAAEWWRRQRDLVLALVLAHVALVAVLAAYYGAPALLGAAGLLLLLALANLARFFRRVPVIVWICSLALIILTLRIDAWWVAVVGDEYSFFEYAGEIATRRSLAEISANWFNGQAVYGSHPFFSSVIQAVSMKLLGVNNFGWRFSNVYLSALAVGLFYVFFRTFTQRRVALVTVILLGLSHYLMSFGKIGYNNLQALFALGLALAAAAWAVRSRALVAYAALGAALGLCLYVYPAAFYGLPLPFLLLWIYDRPREAAGWRRWGVAALTLLLLALPLLLQPGYWQDKILGTLFNRPDAITTVNAVVYHFASNLLYSFFSFLYVPNNSHFVSIGYIDPLSAVFVLLGLGVLLRQARRERFARFMLISFALMLFLVGASHDRETPSATRMFLLLPWWAFMSAMGIGWLLDGMLALGARRGPRAVVLAGLLAAIGGLNIYQAYTLEYQRALPVLGLESLYLRLAERAAALESRTASTFVFVTDASWGIDGMLMLQHTYGVPASSSQVARVALDTPQLPEEARVRLADPNTLVIVQPWLPESWHQSLSSQLEDLGKQSCPVSSAPGQHVVFTLWHGPDFASLCP